MVYDTHTVTLHQDNVSLPNNEEFNWSEGHVAFVVNLAVSTTPMEIETPMVFRNFGVKEVVEGTPFSKVAYIEANAGYFIISEDMMSHINVTYSRWD